jgi:P-type Cu+ transporter
VSDVDLAVLIGSALAIAGLAWCFFAPRRAHAAALTDGVQRVQVTIRGGYSPNVIQVRQGIPVEIEFDRQETGDCSSRIVFPDLHLSAALPAHQRTTVRFTPKQAGSFGFGCGMNMISRHTRRHPQRPGREVSRAVSRTRKAGRPFRLRTIRRRGADGRGN